MNNIKERIEKCMDVRCWREGVGEKNLETVLWNGMEMDIRGKIFEYIRNDLYINLLHISNANKTNLMMSIK